jgi:hypothetical protein
MFAHHSMIPDADVLYSMIETWKNAVEKISDVQGLYPTFVTNISPASAARVAKANGIGNVWGLDDEPLICKATVLSSRWQLKKQY